jgi:Zn-dependent protease
MEAKDIHKEMLTIWAVLAALSSFIVTHNNRYAHDCTDVAAFIQGRRHLVTAATSLQSCAYRSLSIKLDSAAI